MEDPLEHELFKNTKEMNEERFQRLFDCYSIEHFNTILHQDVYKTEVRNVKGHQARNIVAYKLQDLITKRKEKGKLKTTEDNDNTNRENLTEKRSYRKTSENEKRILEKFFFIEYFLKI